MKQIPEIPFRVLGVLLLLAALTVPSARAQRQKPSTEFGELIEVTEVFLDILATDKKGNVIRGLGKDDFLVTEDGQPVEITSASYYSTRYEDDLLAGGELPEMIEAESTAGAAAVEVPASRYFILFFEDQSRNASSDNRLLRQQLEAGRKAHKWVREGLGPSDWVAVVSYDVKLKVHQDFTQDTASLVEAVAGATTNKNPEIPTRRDYRRQVAQAPLSLLKGLPEPGKELRDKTKTIYAAIRLLADAMRPIVGRKNLVLFTIGFGELRANYSEGDQRYYPQMKEALNHANVAVYPVDLMPPGTVHQQSHFMTQMADETGGEYLYNHVSFLTPLRRIAAENTGYYLLSFRTEHPASESGYREVKVKAKQRKIHVRARQGYRYGTGG